MSARLRWPWAASLGLFLALSAAAQDPGFVLQGEGGLVTAFALDPSSSSTIYAATARGLYKSTDAGASWRKTGAGLRDHSLLAIAVDPKAPSNVYATTDTGGVFRSTDAGEHWSEGNVGISARYVGAIAAHPRRPGWVYAGAEAGRVFQSEDGAATWKELPSPTTHVAITVIAVDPAAERVYAGTNSEGVFWSDDGVLWARPSGRMSRGTVWNLTFDGAAGEIFAGTHDGFFRSADRGATWTPANKGLRSWNVLSIAADPSSPSTLYVGTAAAIYKSTDRGRSWNELKADLYVTALAIDPRAPSTLYAATHVGVIKSDDAGERWTALRMAPRPEEPALATGGARRAVPAGGGDDGAGAASLPVLPLRARPVRVPTPSLPPLPVKPSAPAP